MRILLRDDGRQDGSALDSSMKSSAGVSLPDTALSQLHTVPKDMLSGSD